MNRKEKEMNARRESIVAAAEELFLDKGFQNVTMEEVPQKVEFNR
jgi:AcrR family transcriptional regulator